MTGWEALAEAARLETARVYGGIPRQTVTAPAGPVELDPQILALHRAGQSPASIAFRLGCSRARVVAALTRRRTA